MQTNKTTGKLAKWSLLLQEYDMKVIHKRGILNTNADCLSRFPKEAPRNEPPLPDWNKGKSFKEFGQTAPFLLIADDAMGGFFLLNVGGLGNDLGKVYYFSPDNLEYEPLDLNYTDFLNFCFNNNLDEFYKGYRWTNWKEEISKLSGDKTYNFFPTLWTKEGKDINKVSRKAVPVEEQYNLNLDFRKQLGLDK